MVLWGIGRGAQNFLLKAILTSVMSAAKRSTGFGLFYTAFGTAWFLGGAAMGFLYQKSIVGLIVLFRRLSTRSASRVVLGKDSIS